MSTDTDFDALIAESIAHEEALAAAEAAAHEELLHQQAEEYLASQDTASNPDPEEILKTQPKQEHSDEWWEGRWEDARQEVAEMSMIGHE